MSDFLVSMGDKYSSELLLSLLKQPYGKRAKGGKSFRFPWGALAVLEDHLADNKNIICKDGEVFGWVGDLAVNNAEGFVPALIGQLVSLRDSKNNTDFSIENNDLFKKLNGAFLIFYANEKSLIAITDPLCFTQVFMGQGCNVDRVSLSTHPDLAAMCADVSENADLISIAQRFQNEYCTFPDTMYSSVKELRPGSAYCIDWQGGTPTFKRWSYWSPPVEIRDGYDAEDLRVKLSDAFISSVYGSCSHGTAGVAISGGLDSRMVMAAIPQQQECMGFTLCDTVNREALTAKRVAAAYRRPWVPLFRSQDYVADTLIDIVRFIGFECDFVHAHLAGFSDVINSRVNSLLTGDLLDTILRAYTAKDYVFTKRLGGLLPGRNIKKSIDNTKTIDAFCNDVFREDILDAGVQRRRVLYEESKHQNRGSIAEWLKVYPFRHWVEAATWSAQRRILPIRLAGSNRRLLDFAFSCPIEMKLNNKIFLEVAKGVLGEGLRIPNANNGVRPCSGHWSRLLQRGVRKLQDRTGCVLEKMGKKPAIQHSWHDYQAYWKESRKIEELREEYGSNLDSFDGVLFKESGRRLLNDENTEWRYGFCLLQLAIWRGVIKEYRHMLPR